MSIFQPRFSSHFRRFLTPVVHSLLTVTLLFTSVIPVQTYDGLGNRYQQTAGGQTTTFTLDLNSSLPQVLSDGVYTYLYGLDRLAQESANSAEFFLPDGLGSARQLTNAYGGVTFGQAFDPFGSVIGSQGYDATHYGFTGEQESASGLIYLRARYYSPAQGRFVSRDPFPGYLSQPSTLNPYAYALNNPATLTDPSREFTCQKPPDKIIDMPTDKYSFK